MELVRFVMIVPVMTVNDAILGHPGADRPQPSREPAVDRDLFRLRELRQPHGPGRSQGPPRLAGRGRFLRPQAEAGRIHRRHLGIHLLKVFMDVGQYDPEQIRWMVVIHLVFVISGVLLAAMDWIANHAKS